MLIINVAAVFYLLLSKRLFGVRGGHRPYEASLHEVSLLEVEAGSASWAGRRGREGRRRPSKRQLVGPASSRTTICCRCSSSGCWASTRRCWPTRRRPSCSPPAHGELDGRDRPRPQPGPSRPSAEPQHDGARAGVGARDVISGSRGGVEAFLAGDLTVRGNLALALQLDGLFPADGGAEDGRT